MLLMDSLVDWARLRQEISVFEDNQKKLPKLKCKEIERKGKDKKLNTKTKNCKTILKVVT